MILDEQALSDALHEIDVATPGDLLHQSRRGGHRRLIRRRACAVAGVVAAAGVAAPIAMALRGDRASSVETARQHLYPGLFAPPPTPGSQCNAGSGADVSDAVHPDLLLLPPVGQDAEALVRPVKWTCDDAHVALTALKTHGAVVEAGLVIEGPNAPTPVEVARAGPGVHSSQSPGRLPIHGQAATEFRFATVDFTDAYWTESDGGQWYASVRGMNQAEAVDLLNQVTIDSHAGTATLPDAERDGWTVEPSAVEGASSDGGQMYVNWMDFAGHAASMTVLHGPDRVSQFAAGAPAGPYRVEGYRGPVEFVTVRGHRAVLGTGGAPLLFWQESPNVEVTLAINHATTAEIRQVAESLTLADPSDPRISRD